MNDRDGADRIERSRAIVQLLSGRWSLAVLAELQNGGRRYQDLDEALDGVSHKVLTDTLRRAERDGLVVRHLDPSRVDTATLYHLTDLGRSLDDPLTALERWFDANWSDIEKARRRWSQRKDSMVMNRRRH
jgi:DNA-binding HxlR family transcriptional regulator